PPHSSTRQRSRGLAGSRVGRVPRPSGYRAAFPRACTAAMKAAGSLTYPREGGERTHRRATLGRPGGAPPRRRGGSDARVVELDSAAAHPRAGGERSEEHTSELQSRFDLVCRLLLEKKKHKVSRKHAEYR